MSSLVVDGSYDPVLDSQRHYRVLLNSTARPGTIGLLEDATLAVPPVLNRATVVVARTLFSSDVSFYLQPQNDAAIHCLRNDSQATQASASEADFLIVNGTDAGSMIEALTQAKGGSLPFPDTGATMIVQVSSISPAPLSDAVRLTLTGPGIESTAEVFISGIDDKYFAKLAEKNSEFPIGVDTFFTCESLSAGPCVLALPRTTQVAFQRI